MVNPDRPIIPGSDEHAFIKMASRFAGIPLAVNREGLRVATGICLAQHELTLPPYGRDEMTRMVVQRDHRIRRTHQLALTAIDSEAYTPAVEHTNHLSAFGLIDYNDALEGEAFDLSLSAHRALATRLYDRFSTTDSFLERSGRSILTDIVAAAKSRDKAREHELLRGVVHAVVFDGTLGPEALEHFDPLGMGTIE